MGKYVIFSFDGGGVRGLITLRIVEAIEKLLPMPIQYYVDQFVGTSSGGVLALGLASELSTKKLEDFYIKNISTVFTTSFWHPFGLFDSKYKTGPFEDILKALYKNKKLGDLNKSCFVTTSNISTGAPCILSSDAAKLNIKDDMALWEAARCTSAAPTYFDPYLRNNSAFVDGGLFANNPAHLAVFEACFKKDIPLKDILIISVGSGEYLSTISADDSDSLGAINWAVPISGTIINLEGKFVDNMLREVFKGSNSYFRLNPRLDYDIQLDDTSDDNIKDLDRVAAKYIEENKKTLHQIATFLNDIRKERLQIC